ncbi:MAG TPA: isoprenylcysteine carboxylmethyltransferase family protein [Gemmatimonadaceae bacterium]
MKGEPNDGATAIHPVMHIPVPWVFILVYLIGIGAQLLFPIRVRLDQFAGSIRVAGLVLVAIGILVAFSAQAIFRRVHTTTIPFEKPSTFVTSGPYRFTRNPMYLGLTLIYVGVAGTRLEIWPLIVLPMLLAYANFVVIPVEERRLSAVFGDAYQRYCASVRRWL